MTAVAVAVSALELLTLPREVLVIMCAPFIYYRDKRATIMRVVRILYYVEYLICQQYMTCIEYCRSSGEVSC